MVILDIAYNLGEWRS